MKLIIKDNPELNGLPWLTDQAVDFLEDYLKNKDLHILEFGTGSSTLWFSSRAKGIVSVEHDERWYNLVCEQLATQNIKNVDYRLVKSFYYSECEKFPQNYFDLILIDGKDRVLCVEHAMRVLKPGGILMLDNAERPKYQIIYDMLKDWEFTKTVQVGPSKIGFEQENWQTNWWIKPNK